MRNTELFARFQKGLLTNYILGSFFAVFGVGSMLLFLTLELTKAETLWMISILIFSVAIMFLAEITWYKRDVLPIKLVFTTTNPSLEELRTAFIQTAKFPTLTFKRIMIPHLLGLSIPASIGAATLIELDNLHIPWIYIVFAWCGAILIATMHGLIEFFLTIKIIQPLLIEIRSKAHRVYHDELPLPKDAFISIKKKLLFSSLFLAIYPIFLFSLAVQVQFTNESEGLTLSFWHWAAIILFVVVSFAIFGSFLVVNDIKRPMDELAKGFLQVGERKYVQIENSYIDEFSNVVAGFNQMVSSIKTRDETNRQLLDSFFTVFAATLDARDPYTAGHSIRVAEYAVKIGEKAALTAEQLDLLKKSALLHDIGKIGIHDNVLLKDGKLTDEEFEEIKKHPLIGERILLQIQPNDAMKDLMPGVKYHHERYDGKGYPSGLKGEDIPLFGRILAVADAFDAMTSNRPYRKGMSFEKALSILREGKGTQWDPLYVQLFIDTIQNENQHK